MCTPHRLFSLVLATALMGCGGGLTLPQDASPPEASPTTLQAVSGGGQQGIVGSRLDEPLVVKLTDASSQPMAGVSIVFQFTNDVPGADVDPEAVTDSLGRASAQVRLGTSTGSHQVEARVATATALSATFVLTALERDRGKKDKGGKGGGDDDDHDDDDDDDDDDD